MDTQVPVYRATVQTDIYPEWNRTPCRVLCTAVKTSLKISIRITNHMETDVPCLQHLPFASTLQVVADSLVSRVVPLDPSAPRVLTTVKFLRNVFFRKKLEKKAINSKWKIADVIKIWNPIAQAFIHHN